MHRRNEHQTSSKRTVTPAKRDHTQRTSSPSPGRGVRSAFVTTSNLPSFSSPKTNSAPPSKKCPHGNKPNVNKNIAKPLVPAKNSNSKRPDLTKMIYGRCEHAINNWTVNNNINKNFTPINFNQVPLTQRVQKVPGTDIFNKCVHGKQIMNAKPGIVQNTSIPTNANAKPRMVQNLSMPTKPGNGQNLNMPMNANARPGTGQILNMPMNANARPGTGQNLNMPMNVGNVQNLNMPMNVSAGPGMVQNLNMPMNVNAGPGMVQNLNMPMNVNAGLGTVQNSNVQVMHMQKMPRPVISPKNNKNPVELQMVKAPNRSPQQRTNPPGSPAQTNKNAKPNSPPPKNDKITEIYKRPTSKNNKHPSSAKSSTIEPPNSENLNFQKVTQDLANIIRNFQQQIHDVPISKATMGVPSAMIQPKIKEFFKNEQSTPPPSESSKPTPNKPSTKTKPEDQNKNQNSKSQANKSTDQFATKISGISKQRSLRNFSRPSMAPGPPDIRRFNSFTNPTLTVATSVSHRKVTHRSSSLGVDPLKTLKDEVQKAIRERKTFTVRGHYLPIRKALASRGWVEKYHASYKDHLNDELKRYQNYSISELLPLTRREDLTDTCKKLIKSKLLGGYQVDFYWGTNDEAFRENPDKIKLTLINKLKREIFSYTNKQGLCDASKSSYWYQKPNVSKLNHPRTYSLGKNGDVKGFMEDFNITAAMSLLKWVIKMNSTKECKLLSPTGKIPLETFDFALNECCKFIKKARHEDIDMQIPDAKEHEWTQFLDYFYKLVHYNNHFLCEGIETDDSLVQKCNYVLNNLRSLYPFVDMDGMMNIWILKPTASSRGRGIHMCRTLQYVLKVIKQNVNVRYIIQKYIERPLLIYNTKFDIRQWFLISNCCPLTIWMYNECYLRFSSQTYNLRKLHESIHLTNNSVQCKYKNTSLDTALPSYNMWDSADFQKYLSNIGYPSAFTDTVFPGMKQCITAAVLMHQEKMIIRKNCFELYGADFILTEDFQPWLLEINSSPALYGSTPVTARMCPKVLEDVIKVVIDYSHNNKADTGGFQMVYKQTVSKLPAVATFELKGMPLHSSYFFNAPDHELNDASTNQNAILADQSPDCLKMFGDEIKKTLKNLLQIIHNEKHKRGLIDNQNMKSVVSVE